MNTKNTLPWSINGLMAVFVIFTAMPVKLNYSSMAIILLAILSIIVLLFNGVKGRPGGRMVFVLTIPLLVYLLGLINTSNLAEGMSFVGRNASFLAFPIIFFGLGKWINKRMLLITFLIALAITDLYLIYLFVYYFNFGARFSMVVTSDIYHSTYLGMYNLIAFWICITHHRFEQAKFYLPAAAFFLLASIATSSRMVFILAAISVLATLFILMKSNRNRWALGILLVVLMSGVLLYTPSIRQRFEQVMELEQLEFEPTNYKSVSSRLGKVEATLNVIRGHFLFGTGTGDLMDELVKEYKRMNFTMGYKYRYNPHNQYLDNLARNGITGGGISLIIIYLFPVYVAFKNKDMLLAATVIVISGVSLTESILDVHKGITFYCFFITLLLAKPPLTGNSGASEYPE